MGVMDDKGYEASKGLYEIREKISDLSSQIDELEDKAIEGCSHAYDLEIDALIEANHSLIEAIVGVGNKLSPDLFSPFTAQVTNKTESLVNAISTVPDGSYPLAIISGFFSALVAAGVAFLINHLYVNYLNKVNEKAYYSDVSLSLLDEFETIAIRYWIAEKSDSNREDMSYFEVKMVSILKVLRTSLKKTNESLSDDEKHCREVISGFSPEVYDLATGEDFQSEDKASNSYIAKKIAAKCSSLKSTLLKHSKEIKN